MSQRRNLYVAGAVGASMAYIFVTLATTGQFNVLYWATFMAVFLVVFAGFEWFIGWAESLDE